MLNNWTDQLNNTHGAARVLEKASPDLVAAYRNLGAQQNATGTLDAKTRELIALAVAITTRCDSCIASHAKAAVLAGASESDIADAIGTTMALNAGAAYAYSMRAMEAFQQFKTS